MKQRGGPPVPVPSFIWDYFKPLIDPHVMGSASIDGVDTTVVAFFGHAGDTGVWFRLWIDGDGLVRRAEMRANGHFMDHTYFDFGAPLSITPPVGAGG